MKRECETCIKRKTPCCPTSIDCMATDDMPYYQNIIMLLEENQELKNSWNKLKEIMEEETREYWNTNILEIMQKIEGSDSNGIK